MISWPKHELSAEVRVPIDSSIVSFLRHLGMVGGQMLNEGEGQGTRFIAISKIREHKDRYAFSLPFVAASIVAQNLEVLENLKRNFGHT